ncbi:TetR/AcrR family transcriptional regulator [Amycolatopsis cynarae]|uniref:TetR/AcrR family transcriptional regulator n=1 Tax=Amycolatopsis cynarae TaxID=2995223 RepID=A0ABY7B734_9PSEU|nr:TetR/AcrR family transcriptional regulator [Amycolatopsis sp. HUAS 11-8]WAL67754.1 TetR/AcrR family transcriptional regulator [Amycolatopsis sp. HUAS 11-8]
MTDPRATRRKRANGEESRRRILDAAVEVAGERGYDGTSIALVSAKCGLPASSIYWHFKDKDELIAAVIERSFTTWLDAVSLSDTGRDPARQRVRTLAFSVAKALLEAPDFLRLGLMLALEHRPQEPSARTMFLQARETTHRYVAGIVRELDGDLDEDAVQLLTTYAIAAADGLFIAKEIGGESVDLIRLFELHARGILAAAEQLATPTAIRPCSAPTTSPAATAEEAAPASTGR